MRYRQSCQRSWLKIETAKILDSTWTPDLHRVYRNTALRADNSKEMGWYRKHIGKRIDTDSTYWTISSHSTERCKNTTGTGHGECSFKLKRLRQKQMDLCELETALHTELPASQDYALRPCLNLKKKIKKQRNLSLPCDVAFHNNE